MILSRPALIVLLGPILGNAAPCAAQTLPRLGLSGPEVGMDLSARPSGGRRAGRPEADAVIRQPGGIGRSRTLALGRAEEIEREEGVRQGIGRQEIGRIEDEHGMAPVVGEGGWPVDLRGWGPSPRSARAEP